MARTHINSCDFSLGNYAHVEDENDLELKTFSLERNKISLIPMINDALKKRKNKIMSLGYTPLRGYIKSAFSFGEIVFVPDHKKKNKKTLIHKQNKNNNLSKINEGDLMVHISHGVGRFGGLVVRGPSGYEKEYIKLEYKEGGVLYVPINKSDLVHRYIGIGGKSKLNKLGGKEWSRDVSKTKKELITQLHDIYQKEKKKETPISMEDLEDDLFGNPIMTPCLGNDGQIYDIESMNYLFQKNEQGEYVNIPYKYNENN